MPTLEWIGKNKVVNHHQEVPFRVLERQYSFDEQGQHTENNDSENMIIHGDNRDKGRFDFFGISSSKKRLSPAGKVRFSSLGDCTEGL